MSRVLVVGPRGELEAVIERLYEMRMLHLVDHHGEDDVFSIGDPLEKASEISEHLVKVRSIASILKIEEAQHPEEPERVSDVKQRIATLELNLREEEEARKSVEALLQDLDRQIEEIRPFAALRLPLDTYRGYESLSVLVGRVQRPVGGLEALTRAYEIEAAEGVVAVFVPRALEGRVRERLGAFGFAEIPVPDATGDPRTLLAAWERDRKKWGARREEIESRLTKLREKFARFLLLAEGELRVEIEKAEAPLRFAVSDHTFVIDGWVPAPRSAELEAGLSRVPGLHIEAASGTSASGHGGREGHEEPPVLLRNPRPVRRFEFLSNLYSTPRHDEADPTAFMFLLFPVFFGLMIGDVGYGVVMIVLGFVLSTKLRDNPDFADLMRVILYGGVFAYIFGLLMYGEIFGIPFHAPAAHPEEISWSAILGFKIPYLAPVHKLEAVGVIDLLLISIVASFIHLGLGYAVGFFNEIRHDKKHALSRVGWLLVLLGLFAFFAVLGRAPAGTEASHRVVNQLFFDVPPLVWIPAEGLSIGTMSVPWFSVYLIVAGIIVLLPTEGGIAPVETISLLANMMSYTRLAGVAVAKGAVALAFNTMFLPLIIDYELFATSHVLQLNPNVLFLVIGFVFIFLAHAMVLILGAISAGIQAIRLNYVEFFLKFFKGGGTLFSPFGAQTKRTEA